jgi:site-specific DNA-adenine methylase
LETKVQKTEFTVSRWQDTVSTSTANDIVFLDPPYTTRTFKEYSQNDGFNQSELADWFKTCSSRAIIVLNKDDFTTNLYADYIKEEYSVMYSSRYRQRVKSEDVTTKHFIATNFTAVSGSL